MSCAEKLNEATVGPIRRENINEWQYISDSSSSMLLPNETNHWLINFCTVMWEHKN